MPIVAPSVPTLAEIRAAAKKLAPYIVRTPLLRLNAVDSPNEIFLKLENLQPIGAFKVRSMGNAILTANKDAMQNGVYTASSGNAGLGLAWMAQQMNLSATVYAPRSAPAEKLDLVRNFGATVRLLDDDQWWQIIEMSGHPGDPGLYIDAVRNSAALAGNATIGLEIVEDLPDVDTIIVPFGGGGVACGISSAVREIRPDVQIIVAESDAATPVTAALEAGQPVSVVMKPSFISGAGAPSVLKEMWPLVERLVDRSLVTSVSDVANAVRLLFENNHVVAEGAGAIPVAAALASEPGLGKTVCVITGGNIGIEVMAKLLQ